MKTTIILLFLLAISAKSQIVTNATDARVYLGWNYPTNAVSDDLTFVLYDTTNLASGAWYNWHSSQFGWTNYVTTNLSDGTNYEFVMSCEIKPDVHFFTMVSSNFWGLSATSNWAITPPLPLNTELNISK